MSLRPRHRPAGQSCPALLPPAPPPPARGRELPVPAGGRRPGVTGRSGRSRQRRFGNGRGDSAGRAYSVKQWAADTSHLSERMAAPQKCSLFSRRLTCQGNSPRDASEPPTILLAARRAGRLPQPAREEGAARGELPAAAQPGARGGEREKLLQPRVCPRTCSSSGMSPGMTQGGSAKHRPITAPSRAGKPVAPHRWAPRGRVLGDSQAGATPVCCSPPATVPQPPQRQPRRPRHRPAAPEPAGC